MNVWSADTLKCLLQAEKKNDNRFKFENEDRNEKECKIYIGRWTWVHGYIKQKKYDILFWICVYMYNKAIRRYKLWGEWVVNTF